LYELVVRAITGIAIGAAIPNSIALIAEYAPEN
jgi:MFS family permease